jgi:hypothetical protein
MGLAGRFWVFPLYHQVEVRDAADGGTCPEWETGEEAVLAGEQCIVLATRLDLEGSVEIEVWVSAHPERPAGWLLFDGELLTTGQGVVVGSSLTEELYPIPLAIGWHPVQIYADRPKEPARFTVLFDHEGAGS